jgi:hypothetical protein
MKNATIYTTFAECYRDLHEVVSAIHKEHNIWITPKVTPVVPEGVSIEFIVQGRLGISESDIKDCIKSVPDADDMLDNLEVEVYEYSEDWYLEPDYDARDLTLPPMTGDNLRKHYNKIV